MPNHTKLLGNLTASNSLVVPFNRTSVGGAHKSQSSVGAVAPMENHTSEEDSDEDNENGIFAPSGKRRASNHSKRPLSCKVTQRGGKKGTVGRAEVKRLKKSTSANSVKDERSKSDADMQVAVCPMSHRRSVQSVHGNPASQLRTRTNLTNPPKIILILDTNILLELHGLAFLEALMASYYDDLPSVQVHIPHAVLLELDRQKSRFNSPVQSKANQAIHFLFDEICDDFSVSNLSTHKRIVGQTVRDYTSAQENLQQEIDDDHILFCCLQMKDRNDCSKDNNSAAIWCLTNDTNLRIRCVFNGVPAYDLNGLLDNVEKRRQGRPSIFDTVAKSMSTAAQENSSLNSAKVV